MGLYVEDQLSRHFSIMVDFVKKAEQQQKRLAVPEGQAIQGFAPQQVRGGIYTTAAEGEEGGAIVALLDSLVH
jgi:hypothetical protein